MDHAVSMTDGRVPPEEKLRLEAIHGKAQAAQIIAEFEAANAPPAKPKKSTTDAAAAIDNGDA